MLLTIHNLPISSSYGEVKELIVAKCGLKDCILDKLQNEGSGMRVTVGVGEEEDAAILVRKVNGLYFRGQQLYVQDKRQKKDSEQPYRMPIGQQSQYQAQQPQQGYDYANQMQSMGMYNFAMFQSTGMETVQNCYSAYGGHQAQQQPQPLMAQVGQFGEYRQQPFSTAPAPVGLVARGSASPERNRTDNGDRWEASRQSGDRNELRPQLYYKDSRGFRNERLDRSRGFDKPQDRFDKRAPHQLDPRGGHAPFASDVARGDLYGNARGGPTPSAHESRAGNFSDPRGGHALSAHESRAGNYGNSRGGPAPNAFESRAGNYGNSRGGPAPTAFESRAGNYGNLRDGPAPSAHVSHTGNYGNSRGGLASSAHDARVGNYSDARGGRAADAHESRAGNYSNPRSGHAPSANEPRAGNYAPSAQESRAGRFGNTRGAPARDRRPRDGIPPKRRRAEPDRGERKPARVQPWRSPPRAAPRDELRAKRFAAARAGPAPDARRIPAQKGDTVSAAINNKIFKACVVKGTGKLMYEIAKALNVVHVLEGPNPVKTALRKFVSSRVSAVLGARALPPHAVLARYRERYPPSDDAVLYNEISVNIAEKEAARVKQALALPDASKKLIKVVANKKLSPLPPGKIPSRPHGEQKQQNKDTEAMDATFKKVIDEEVELIGPVLEKEFTNPSDKTEQLIFDNVDKKECVSDCKKLLIHHLSRRITNSGQKLVRIYGRPRAPRRPELERFLAPYGCLALRKSVSTSVYHASFDSYDTVDELVSLDAVEIGGVVVTFKHMHVGPGRPRIDLKDAKLLRRKYVDSLIEKSKVNLLDKGWQIPDKEEKKAKTDYKESKSDNGASEADDVIYVGGTNKEGLTVDITGEDDVTTENAIKEKKEVSVEITDDNDFLHGDFKVIDEVRESDNDEVGNESNVEEGYDGYEIADDWDEAGEDWSDVNEVNNDEAVEHVKTDSENNITNDDDDDDDDEDIGEFNAEDVDLDDINEDDLEDY